MLDECDKTVVFNVNELYDFFGRLGIINYEEFYGDTCRQLKIYGSAKGRWVGIDILTTDENHSVETRFSIRKDCRYLSIEGNIKEDKYRVNIPRYPLEEDKEVRDIMRRLLLSLKPYELKRDTPLVIKEAYYV